MEELVFGLLLSAASVPICIGPDLHRSRSASVPICIVQRTDNGLRGWPQRSTQRVGETMPQAMVDA
jgi:hypothetical protein